MESVSYFTYPELDEKETCPQSSIPTGLLVAAFGMGARERLPKPAWGMGEAILSCPLHSTHSTQGLTILWPPRTRVLSLLLKDSAHKDPTHVEDREETCTWTAGTEVWGELGERSGSSRAERQGGRPKPPTGGRTWKAIEGGSRTGRSAWHSIGGVK